MKSYFPYAKKNISKEIKKKQSFMVNNCHITIVALYRSFKNSLVYEAPIFMVLLGNRQKEF